MLSFFSRGVLDEILNLNESVSEGFPSYSFTFAPPQNTLIGVREKNVKNERNDGPYITIFYVIGKKNKLISIFDADREIPTLGSTGNAGNLVNLVFSIICLPSGWYFCVTIRDR